VIRLSHFGPTSMKAEGGTVIHNTIMDVMMKKIKMISFLLIFFVEPVSPPEVGQVVFAVRFRTEG